MTVDRNPSIDQTVHQLTGSGYPEKRNPHSVPLIAYEQAVSRGGGRGEGGAAGRGKLTTSEICKKKL